MPDKLTQTPPAIATTKPIMYETEEMGVIQRVSALFNTAAKFITLPIRGKIDETVTLYTKHKLTIGILLGCVSTLFFVSLAKIAIRRVFGRRISNKQLESAVKGALQDPKVMQSLVRAHKKSNAPILNAIKNSHEFMELNFDDLWRQQEIAKQGMKALVNAVAKPITLQVQR